ncbi:hypothetical protein [Siccirubricoccus sp. G192]|uniref:hypothetical protein n=1 Tax=Siccirubricoccus sp. G192 TaxID=2849651 RepID=UPI0028115695|nr:hypothetical protein [Siccirubricoccus sp. G192]
MSGSGSRAGGIESGFFWYVTGFFILALVSAWFLPETRIESHLAREHGGVGARAGGSAALP